MHWTVLAAAILGAGSPSTPGALEPVTAGELTERFRHVQMEADPGPVHHTDLFFEDGVMERDGRWGPMAGRFTVHDGGICVIVEKRSCWDILRSPEGDLFMGRGGGSREPVARIRLLPLAKGLRPTAPVFK
ncbi:MAG: hypothetical protein V4466_04285 [Pseudomonadota bacterium]